MILCPESVRTTQLAYSELRPSLTPRHTDPLSLNTIEIQIIDFLN